MMITLFQECLNLKKLKLLDKLFCLLLVWLKIMNKNKVRIEKQI
jgi:hypothetical protein